MSGFWAAGSLVNRRRARTTRRRGDNCFLCTGQPGDWRRRNEDFSYGRNCYPLYNKRRKGTAGWHLCLSRRKLDQQTQAVTPEENPLWQVGRPQGLVTLHLNTGHFSSAPLTAAHGLAKRWGQLTLEGEILSEGCSWGSGLQKHEGAGQGRARDGVEGGTDLARGWCCQGQERVSVEGAGWMPQGADNDGEENIAGFLLGAVNQVPLWATLAQSLGKLQWKNLQSHRCALKKKVLVLFFEFLSSLLIYLKI